MKISTSETILGCQMNRNSDFDYTIVSMFSDCCCFAAEFLTIPNNLKFGIASYETGFFTHPNAPSFTTADGSKVFFNRQWLERSYPEHTDDIRFFMFHELRHVYQKYQIDLYAKGERISETSQIIEQWAIEFQDYRTNFGDISSQESNLNQEIEQDANAYGLALLYMFNIEKGSEIECSLPEPAFIAADRRAREYINTRSELRRYLENRAKNTNEINYVKGVPGAYDPCPCGSGKKFKFCCYKKGIYK